jgi:hypothetical protein
MKTQKVTISHLTNSINLSPLRQDFFLTLFVLACFAFVWSAQAVSPAPDGGYPGANTAEGQNALVSLTTGGYNTAVGYLSLRSNTDGSFNTAVGAGTLLFNVGDQSTGEGIGNTAIGTAALLFNATGSENTAVGAAALLNTTGDENTATGFQALFNTTTGGFNTANGASALQNNSTGDLNTAIGSFALINNITGSENNALGYAALSSNTGSGNTAIGDVAGSDLTTGSGNVCIGKDVRGVAGESDTTRIRNVGLTPQETAIYVTLDSVGGDKLGYVAIPSSRRYKDEIKAMDKTSEALFGLKPVNFRYKHEINPDRAQRFGLIAEEVEKINPALVSYDSEGKPLTVRYESINAMLLNEFLKEHRKVEEQIRKIQEQEASIKHLKTTVAQQQEHFEAAAAQQQKTIEAVTARLDEQAAQIQNVTADINPNRPTSTRVSLTDR